MKISRFKSSMRLARPWRNTVRYSFHSFRISIRLTFLRKDNWILLQKEVRKLGPPRSIDVNFLRQWLGHPNGGNNFLENAYAEGDAWNKPDLVTMCTNEVMEDTQMDSLTKWIHDMLPWFHEHLGCRLTVLPSIFAPSYIFPPDSPLTRN